MLPRCRQAVTMRIAGADDHGQFTDLVAYPRQRRNDRLRDIIRIGTAEREEKPLVPIAAMGRCQPSRP